MKYGTGMSLAQRRIKSFRRFQNIIEVFVPNERLDADPLQLAKKLRIYIESGSITVGHKDNVLFLHITFPLFFSVHNNFILEDSYFKIPFVVS
jgi:hypothetical protein